MTSRDFCYWLQGYMEIATADAPKPTGISLSTTQVSMIQKHLAMVFKHEIDPLYGDQKIQAALSHLHHGDVGDIGGDVGDTLIRC